MSGAANSSDKNVKDKALNGVGNIIRLLPTGAVFFYQIFNPLLTNSGKCNTTNKVLSGTLIGLCGLSCFFSTFTDSYKDSEGKIHYGIATFKGFSTSSSSSYDMSIDLSSYKLQVGDFVHGLLALIVFGVVSLLDSNTVQCFYPSFESNQKALLMGLPAILGSISGTVFFLFPCKRHGIGYPRNWLGAESESSSDGNQKV